MLIYSDKPAGTAFDRIGTHKFVASKNNERYCSECGEYWKTYNHIGAFDKSTEGKECLFYDEFIRHQSANSVNEFSERADKCMLLKKQGG